jgi:hypothetical protein
MLQFSPSQEPEDFVIADCSPLSFSAKRRTDAQRLLPNSLNPLLIPSYGLLDLADFDLR